MTQEHPPLRHAHSHMWVVGVVGIVAGLALMVYVPSLTAVSSAVVLFAGFHLVGAIAVLASIYVTAGERLSRRSAGLRGGRRPDAFDFGWAPAWTNGPWIAALVALAIAVVLSVAAPAYWGLAILLTLLSAAFFAGYLFVRESTRHTSAVLPMVDLVSGNEARVLDAGCGAGRTTIAIGRAAKAARIIALDRFDADYIEGGGRQLLERNLRLAGLSARVDIERGDLTAVPLATNSVDAVVSAHAIDHLGPATGQGLREMLRVLKPGGRFHLVVWVRGWVMFSVANLMSFFLRSRRDWRRLTTEAGFELVDDGTFNGVYFLLLKKP
ncbi:MAG: class I SAM-dependent methyltransferase [Vicinamibacterales bacterium]